VAEVDVRNGHRCGRHQLTAPAKGGGRVEATDRECLLLAQRPTDVPTLSLVSSRSGAGRAEICGQARICVGGSGQPAELETS
jgi:hypothetical protein